MYKEDGIKARYTTYKQDWPAYNKAKTKEKVLFVNLVRDLIAEIYPEEKKLLRRGRPPIPDRDMLFASCLRSYSDYSSRISISELRFTERLGFIGHTPHFNSLTAFLRKAYVTDMLYKLLVISALPLRRVESQFAVDSTGFTPVESHRWAEVHAEVKKRRLWKKLHLICGTKTHIIASVEITDGNANDAVTFKAVYENAAKFFEIKEMMGDKAYSSRAILEQIGQSGAIPYIPFRKNVSGKSRGSRWWRKIYREFVENQEDFMRHYHRRSNVETTFAMIKRKLGERIRAKNDRGMLNELLCRCICHNITVLIQEMYELGIDVDFEQAKLLYREKEYKAPKQMTLCDLGDTHA